MGTSGRSLRRFASADPVWPPRFAQLADPQTSPTLDVTMSDEYPYLEQREDYRLDGILRLIELAGKRGPLDEVLATLCKQIAVIAHADIVSIYVAKDDALVMRANIGFDNFSPGTVRLKRGEGLVGATAAAMRPFSASIAKDTAEYKHIPNLGEEHFPSLLAVPLLSQGAAIGVLALQRGETVAFTDAEVALATALATTITHALERTDSQDAQADRTPRSARLVGHLHTSGTALARAVLLGTLESIEARGAGLSDPGQQVAAALGSISAVLRKGQRRIADRLSPEHRKRMLSFALVLDDQRLQTTMANRCNELGVVQGLKQVAREYAGATYVTGAGDPLLAERAMEVEHLCLLVAAAACDLPYAAQGCVLVVPEHLTATLVLAVCGWRGEAIVVAGSQPPDCLGLALARSAGLPVLGDVPGLFAWVRQGDTLLLDADEGVLRVNPPATLIAKHRHHAR